MATSISGKGVKFNSSKTTTQALSNNLTDEGKGTIHFTTDGDIVLNGTNFTGVKTVTQGSANGTISVNNSDVSVKGLGTAAYTDASAYATAAQGTLAANAVPNTRTVNGKALSSNITLNASDVNALPNTTNYAGSSSVGGAANSVANSLTVGGKTFNGSEAVTITADDLGLSNAMHFAGVVASLPTASKTDSYSNGDVILVGNKEYVRSGKSDSAAGSWVELGDESSYAVKATTLAGYGITDAKIDNGTITLGSNTVTPLTAASTLNAEKISGTIPASCYTNTTYNDYAGSAHGLVPAKTSSTASANKVLAETGAWVDLPTLSSVGGQETITATGVLKGNGNGSVVAATAGTDYLAPVTATTDAGATATQLIKSVTQSTDGKITVTKSTYTINTSVPANAVFTDTKDAANLTCTSAQYCGSANTTSVQTALNNIAAATDVNTSALSALIWD